MFYIFNNINDYKRKELLGKIKIQSKIYQKGECIFHEDDDCNYIGFIKKGLVFAKNIIDDNHEIVIRTLISNDSFGEGLIFLPNPKYKATFIAEEITEIQFISKDDLILLFKENEQVMINVFSKLNEQSVIQMKHIKLLSLKTVKSKVASFFYFKYQETHSKTFSVSLNKTEIARYLNVERPTFSKELNDLIRQDIISYFKKTYTINNLNKLLENIN